MGQCGIATKVSLVDVPASSTPSNIPPTTLPLTTSSTLANPTPHAPATLLLPTLLPLPSLSGRGTPMTVHSFGVGWQHSAIVTTDGDLYTFGCNSHNQLGHTMSGTS